jgi:uncharacterized integral membrane protein
MVEAAILAPGFVEAFQVLDCPGHHNRVTGSSAVGLLSFQLFRTSSSTSMSSARLLRLTPLQTVYSSPYLVLLSFFSLAYLSLVIPLTFTFNQTQNPTAKYIAPEREKHTLLIQVYIFTWILLLFSTIAVARAKVGGLYVVTVWNTGVWIACLLAAVEGMMLPVPHGGPRVRFHNAHPHHHHELEDQDADDDEDNQDRRQPPTEATPLIGHSRASLRKPQEGGVVGWWIVHLLLTIPAPVLLIAQMGSLLLDSLPQTLADGSPASVGKPSSFHMSNCEADIVMS